MSDNPYAAPSSDGAAYSSPLPLLRLSQPVLKLSGQVPKESALEMASKCKPICDEDSKKFSYLSFWKPALVAAVVLVSIFLARDPMTVSNPAPKDSGWMVHLGVGVLSFGGFILPWLLLIREGRIARRPENADPPLWANVKIEFDEESYRIERTADAGVMVESLCEWRHANVQQSDEGWLLSNVRTRPALIPNEWINAEADRLALDHFFKTLTKWQADPSNASPVTDVPLPKGLELAGQVVTVTGQQEYKLSNRIRSAVRTKLPEFKYVSTVLPWCFRVWLAIVVVTILACIALWNSSNPTLSSLWLTLFPAAILSFFSLRVLRRSLRDTKAKLVITTDELWLVYDGVWHRRWLRDLPKRMLLEDAVVLSASKGKQSIVLPRESCEDEATWLAVCDMLRSA